MPRRSAAPACRFLYPHRLTVRSFCTATGGPRASTAGLGRVSLMAPWPPRWRAFAPEHVMDTRLQVEASHATRSSRSSKPWWRRRSDYRGWWAGAPGDGGDVHQSARAIGDPRDASRLQQGRGTAGEPWNDQAALASNADTTLERNVAGFYDLLDASGRPPDSGHGDAAGVAYIRRWSVRTFAEDPGRALVLRVVVTGLASAGGPRVLARMVTVRARRDWWEPAP